MRNRVAAEERELRSRVIRLAHQNPAFRPHLLPLLARTAGTEEGTVAGRTWGDSNQFGGSKGNPRQPADDKDPPYNKRNLGPGGCNKEDDDGSCYAERLKYNQRYREEVCKGGQHRTDCGMNLPKR